MKLKKFFAVSLVALVLGVMGVTLGGVWFLNSFEEVMQNAEREWDAQRMIDLDCAERARCAKMPRKERQKAWWCD